MLVMQSLSHVRLETSLLFMLKDAFVLCKIIYIP